MTFDFGKSKGSSKRRASFIDKSKAAPDPLESVEYTDNLETDSRAELDALAEGFRKRRARENDRFADATDSEYWFAVCFKNRRDKEAFLAAIKAGRLGDKYLDGYALAKLLGVELPSEPPAE